MRRRRNAGWLLAAIGLALALGWMTFVVSLLNSCGAGDHGPNEGAEADFCGYGPGEPTNYSALFLLVNVFPAMPVLLGGLLATLGYPRRLFFGGVAVGALATGLIWKLEP